MPLRTAPSQLTTASLRDVSFTSVVSGQQCWKATPWDGCSPTGWPRPKGLLQDTLTPPQGLVWPLHGLGLPAQNPRLWYRVRGGGDGWPLLARNPASPHLSSLRPPPSLPAFADTQGGLSCPGCLGLLSVLEHFTSTTHSLRTTGQGTWFLGRSSSL